MVANGSPNGANGDQWRSPMASANADGVHHRRHHRHRHWWQWIIICSIFFAIYELFPQRSISIKSFVISYNLITVFIDLLICINMWYRYGKWYWNKRYWVQSFAAKSFPIKSYLVKNFTLRAFGGKLLTGMRSIDKIPRSKAKNRIFVWDRASDLNPFYSSSSAQQWVAICEMLCYDTTIDKVAPCNLARIEVVE